MPKPRPATAFQVDRLSKLAALQLVAPGEGEPIDWATADAVLRDAATAGLWTPKKPSEDYPRDEAGERLPAVKDWRNRPFKDWTKELAAQDLAGLGWTLTDYAGGTYRPARAYAAVKDFPGEAKRITAADPRTLLIRCESHNATRASIPAPDRPSVTHGMQGRG